MKPIRSVGVPRETKTAEGRVALTPDGVREFERLGIDVYVEAGAGEGASISDADYVAAGADIVLRVAVAGETTPGPQSQFSSRLRYHYVDEVQKRGGYAASRRNY